MVAGSSGDWPATPRMPSVPKSFFIRIFLRIYYQAYCRRVAVRLLGQATVNRGLGSLCSRSLTAGEPAIFEEHAQAPVQDHAEGENKEERGRLFHVHELVEVAVGQHPNGGEDDHNHEKMLERCIMMVLPSRTRRDVRSNG